MGDVADSEVAGDLDLAFALVGALEDVRDLDHAGAHAAPQVDNLGVACLAVDGGDHARGDVLHVDEVPALQAVLEDVDGLVLQHEGGEDGKDSRVGVLEGLPHAVHVLEPENGVVYAERRAHGLEHFLLGVLGVGVKGVGPDLAVLGGGAEGEPGVATVAVHAEVAVDHGFLGAGAGIHVAALFAVVLAFAVYGAGGGEDDLFDLALFAQAGDCLQYVGGAHDVHLVVLVDLVHGLARASFRRQVDDVFGVCHGLGHGFVVADVGLHETALVLDGCVEVGVLPVVAVDLPCHAVEGGDVVAAKGVQLLDYFRTDKTCAAGDENFLHSETFMPCIASWVSPLPKLHNLAVSVGKVIQNGWNMQGECGAALMFVNFC